MIFEVRNLDEAIAISTLKRGLYNERLIYSLDKIYLRDYADLHKYIQAEEDQIAHQQEEGWTSNKKKYMQEDTHPSQAKAESS